MRLVNYGIGEVSDRLTILALKILHRGADGRPTKHFEDERNVLLTQMRARELNGAWFEPMLELGATNAAIWYAEEALRLSRKQHVELVADPKELQQLVVAVSMAFRIQELNDQRSALVETINKITGDHRGSEKDREGGPK